MLPWTRSLAGVATVTCTGRGEGDFADAGADEGLRRRQRAVLDRPWSMPVQVHGIEVIVVDAPGAGCRAEADALVSARGDVALAVRTADCAPVALASPEGVIGLAHAGWRGLVAGVLEATVTAMRRLGAGEVHAVVGPCIHAECYEFSESDLDAAVATLGEAVRGTAQTGGPALDLPGGVAAALAGAGVHLDEVADACTACSADYWSWRARKDRGRHATVLWLG